LSGAEAGRENDLVEWQRLVVVDSFRFDFFPPASGLSMGAMVSAPSLTRINAGRRVGLGMWRHSSLDRVYHRDLLARN